MYMKSYQKAVGEAWAAMERWGMEEAGRRRGTLGMRIPEQQLLQGEKCLQETRMPAGWCLQESHMSNANNCKPIKA